MARRSGSSHKGVEEKRRTIPIYQHYTLSPGKTKSHHPEAKCNHCLKEFVCGSKQRLIRHIRKCNSISNPDQIIAETLNTLARSSATGQLNQSILEASNLLPSQISHIHHSTTQQLVGQAIQLPSTTITTANSNITNNIGRQNSNDSNNLTSVVMVQSLNNNEHGLVASSSNGSASIPVKKPQKRGRKPGNQSSNGPGIHVTTGIDGKTHFTPASQLPPSIQGTVTSTPLMTQVHNGRGINGNYNNFQTAASASSISAPSLASSGHLSCVTPNHHHATQFKLNTEPIDKAYLKLVITRNLPLSLCDTKEFQSWVKTLANDYKPPSSITLITQNLKYEAHLARQKVSNILVKASKKTINLELHSWPDELRGHTWYGMIAGIEQRRFLISVRDTIDQVSEDNNNSVSQEGNSISSCKILTTFIDDCIKRVGSDRINSLMFSAANNSQDVIVTRARQNLYTNHPSIVTCYCWWHFTNLLCSDIVEFIEPVQSVLRDSNLLMNFINKRPLLNSYLEKFGPFIGASGSLNMKKEDSRWYSHLVCYLLDYIRNNKEGLHKALDAHSASSTRLANDSNNNTSSGNNPLNTSYSSTQRQNHQVTLYQEDAQMLRAKSIVMSTEYWTNLDLALVYLKPIRDIVALSSNHSNPISNSLSEFTHKHQTSTISSVVANNLSIGEYMNWFLNYGRTLLEQWRISPDSHKYQLIGSYLGRFSDNLSDFNLLFAAYLLNPRYRCSFMTQRAKDKAIEEILNIASEFMPEESDGHTIFDQWKLYLGREEPYAVAFDETCQSPLDWWMSVPCAESIRRVALRILRLRTFTSPRPENLFSQLYFYEDETKTYLNRSCFDDVANLRFFYDYEDKVGQTNTLSSFQEQSINQTANFSVSSNGFSDRTNIGQVHNNQLHQTNCNTKSMPNGSLGLSTESNGHLTEASLLNESTNKSSFTDSYSDIVESYISHSDSLGLVSHNSADNMSNLSLESIPGYEQFSLYVDFNVLGVQVVEEPIEKKKRKWTAQEIISKCQSSSHNNNNNNDVDSNKRIKSN